VAVLDIWTELVILKQMHRSRDILTFLIHYWNLLENVQESNKMIRHNVLCSLKKLLL